MRSAIISLGLAAGLIGGRVRVLADEQQPTASERKVVFLCDRGQRITVDFAGNAAILVDGGSQVRLAQQPAASGSHIGRRGKCEHYLQLDIGQLKAQGRLQSGLFRWQWLRENELLGEISIAASPRAELTVREVGALSDFDDIAVRIADVAARLAVLGDRLRDELRSSTFP